VNWLLLAILLHDPITTKITWTVEVSRIVNKRCVLCHGSGSAVDLSTYETARPWAVSIRNQVFQRTMPPWGAVKGYGDFRNDPSLTALEIEILTQWVEGGAPEGDLKYLPSAPVTTKMESPKFRWAPAPTSISKAQTVSAIRAPGPTEVRAILPDGTVQNLLWIRDPQPDYKGVYIFRDPVAMAPGTKIRVTGASVDFGF
jgi:hypothetical protein